MLGNVLNTPFHITPRIAYKYFSEILRMFGNNTKNIKVTENKVPGSTSETILENLDIKLKYELDCFIVQN